MKSKEQLNILSHIRLATKDKKPMVELSTEQREGLRTASGIALSIVAAAGAIAISAVAPNLFSALDSLHKFTKRGKLSFKEKQVKTAQAFYYLRRHGLIQMNTNDGGFVARLTKKGRQKLELLNIDTLRVKIPSKWNGRWWLVAADIPTHQYRWAADLFRKKIKDMGFYPLQRTMWIYPHNPVDKINFLSGHWEISRFITVMEISSMDREDEMKLKDFFKL
jgi:DNA-binding transcriptional regulator PaaX